MTHVIEMPEAEKKVRGLLDTFAMLDVDFFEEEDDSVFPLSFVTMENDVQCVAHLYERFNGAVILRIDAEVGVLKDTPKSQGWALSTPGFLPFVQLRYERLRNTRYARAIATHSVLVENLTPDSLEQIIGSFDFVVPKWTAKAHEIEQEEVNSGSAGTSTCTAPEGGYCDDFEEYISGDSAELPDGDTRAPDGHGIDAVLAELNALIGLGPVKQLVTDFTNVQRVARMREMAGLKTVRPSLHLVFTGNPGTGKTTVARLVGRLYRELGLLSKGHVVETGRHGLVGGYIGQTAIKTQEILESARDGVLFIDEAYSLFVDHHLDFGREAIETIMTFMENNRGRIAVVVAGYPEKMKSFLGANPGLASRFDYSIGFPDYSDAELLEIFELYAAEFDYKMQDDARMKVLDHVTTWVRDQAFANARDVRKLFNEAVILHSAAAMQAGPAFGDQLTLLAADHIPPVGSFGPGQDFTGIGYL